MRVGIIGCGLIGNKRAEALQGDELVACFDIDRKASDHLASAHGAKACADVASLLAEAPEVVVVATIHRDLPELAVTALEAGAHVLMEKPGGTGVAGIDLVQAAAIRAGRLVKVGFNHRFHPGIARAITEARSGRYGPVLSLRGRYGHGGRLGYDREWRADPASSGGGEIVDQGMHLLDLSYWLLGALPLDHAMVRTQFWDAPVDDNAVLMLGEPGGVGVRSPFALLAASWTEWKNTFSLEIACERAKFAVDGLVRSYGNQVLRIYAMRPELGPPDVEEVRYPERDDSFAAEWRHFRSAIDAGGGELLGDLDSARYAWTIVEQAQGRRPRAAQG